MMPSDFFCANIGKAAEHTKHAKWKITFQIKQNVQEKPDAQKSKKVNRLYKTIKMCKKRLYKQRKMCHSDTIKNKHMNASQKHKNGKPFYFF